MQVHCLSLLPVTGVTALCLKSEAFINAATLCIFFENAFCRKRKRVLFGLEELKHLYNKLIETKLLDIAENLHLAIVNIETKLAALSDSESSGSGISRTNSFIDKETPQTVSNYKIGNDSMSNLNTIYDKSNEVDESSEINQSEVVTTKSTSSEPAVIEDKDLHATSESGVNIINEVNVAKVEKTVNGMDQSRDEHIQSTDEIEVSSINSLKDSVIVSESDKGVSYEDRVRMDKSVYNHEGYNETDVSNRVDVKTNLSLTQNTEQDSFTDTSSDHRPLCSLTSSATDGKEHIFENGLVSPEADKINQYNDNLVNTAVIVASNFDNTNQIDTAKDIECEESTITVVETRVITQQKEVAHIIETEAATTLDESDSKIRSDDTHSERDLQTNVETLGNSEQSQSKGPSPVPVATLLKQEQADDTMEDDLDLHSRSSNMGSRRTSLTSLSSLSSAEVYMETLNSSKWNKINNMKEKNIPYLPYVIGHLYFYHTYHKISTCPLYIDVSQNSVDPDQMLHFVAYDKSFTVCLSLSIRILWVTGTCNAPFRIIADESLNFFQRK